MLILNVGWLLTDFSKNITVRHHCCEILKYHGFAVRKAKDTAALELCMIFHSLMAVSLLICDAGQVSRYVPKFRSKLLPPFSGWK
jgi:hypothetical protein